MEIGDIKQQMWTDLKDNLLDSFQQSLYTPRTPEMLFDIKIDPWEMQNFADEKQYQQKLKNFREVLKRNIIKERHVLLLH